MKFLVLLQTFALVFGAPTDERIVGGNNAEEGQFKYQVSLRSDNYHFCGGAIISANTILTAAHCNLAPIETVTVVVGTIRLSKGGTAHKISDFFNHPGWNIDTLENDIALVILSVPVTFGELVRPALIPSYNIQDGSELVASGWGLKSYPGYQSEYLKYFNTKILSASECRKHHESYNPGQICTFVERGTGVCSGDSGGPLVVNNEVHGVTSFAFLCAIDYPDYFTRVVSYRTWILQNMR